MGESITDKIDSSKIVLEFEDPISGDRYIIKKFSGHTFWFENKEGEGQEIRSGLLAPLLASFSVDLGIIFDKNF